MAMNGDSIGFSGQQLSAAMSTFTSAAGNSIEDLEQFKGWAGPKIAQLSGEVGGLREEIRQIRRLLETLTGNSTFTLSNDGATSPLTPALRRVDSNFADLNPPSTEPDGTRELKFSLQQRSPSPSERRAVGACGVARQHEDIEGKQGSGNERASKRRRRDPNYFRLTFTETETQPPPSFSSEDGEEAQTQAPSSPTEPL